MSKAACIIVLSFIIAVIVLSCTSEAGLLSSLRTLLGVPRSKGRRHQHQTKQTDQSKQPESTDATKKKQPTEETEQEPFEPQSTDENEGEDSAPLDWEEEYAYGEDGRMYYSDDDDGYYGDYENEMDDDEL